MTYEEFVTKFHTTLGAAKARGEREGQHACNLLARENSRIASQIWTVRGIDPFYQDEFLPAFWKEVYKLWNE